MHCVTVRIDVHPGHERALAAALAANARCSLEVEPGCHAFDVAVDASGLGIFLYELYDDEQAFAAHLASPHFQAFDKEVAPWIARKTVRTWRKLA